MKPLLLIFPFVILAGFFAQASPQSTDLNRWIEASDFNGVTARFLSLTPMRRDNDHQFSLRISSSDQSHGCLITRTYLEIAPQTLSLSKKQVWRVRQPDGAHSISPALKEAALESDRAIAFEAQALRDKCENLSALFLRGGERAVCERLLNHQPHFSEQTGRTIWYLDMADGKKAFHYSRNTKQDDFLENASRGLTLKLVSEKGQTLGVRCGHNRSPVSMNQNPETVIGQYRSLLTSLGIELKKNGKEFKPFVTNADENSALLQAHARDYQSTSSAK